MKNIKHQAGVSLVIALVVLLVITILGISAVRISTQDIIIASNEQQQIMVSQASESARMKVVNFYNLFKWLNDQTTPTIETQNIDTGEIHSTVSIQSGNNYICYGQSGEAMSLGSGATQCRIYAFRVSSQLSGTGARNTLVKGEGKELPSSTKGSL